MGAAAAATAADGNRRQLLDVMEEASEGWGTAQDATLPTGGEAWVRETHRTLQRLQELLEAHNPTDVPGPAPSDTVEGRAGTRVLSSFDDLTREQNLQLLLESVISNANALRDEGAAPPAPYGTRPAATTLTSTPTSTSTFGVDEHIRPVETFPASYNEGMPAAVKEPATTGSPRVEWGAAAANPVSTTPADFQTTYKCYRSVDWAEICIYNNLCHDGNMIVFFDNEKGDNKTLIPRHFRIGDNSVGHHTFDVYPRPPPTSKGLPNNCRAKGYYRPTKVLAGQTPTKITWTNEAMWVAEPEYRGFEIQHPFFWSHSVFGLWEARFSNQTLGGIFPPMDLVVLPKHANVDFNSWNQETLDMLLQDNTRLLMGGELAQAGINENNLLCSKRAVVIGNKPGMFSGISSCHTFRAATYAKFGLAGADRVRKEKYAPNHLVIWARKGRRGFENLDEIIQLVESYKINYTLVTGHGTFQQQVELMSRAGVLLLGHGAAATNTIFQPHRSVLIEVFPYLRKRFGFQNIAQICGNWYMPIFTWEKPVDNERMRGPRFTWKCDHMSSPDTNHEEECDQAQKASNMLVPLDVLERTLIDAFDTIGVRLWKGGAPPPRPSRPPDMKPESGLN